MAKFQDHLYKGFKITTKCYSELNSYDYRWNIYWNGTTNKLNNANTISEAKEIIDSYIEHNEKINS
jgi:hypothetical protein